MMKAREFHCIVCGEKGIDTSTTKNRLYCSPSCAYLGWRRSHGIGPRNVAPSCMYNKEVSCTLHKCAICGWNPEVEAKRKEALGYG